MYKSWLRTLLLQLPIQTIKMVSLLFGPINSNENFERPFAILVMWLAYSNFSTFLHLLSLFPIHDKLRDGGTEEFSCFVAKKNILTRLLKAFRTFFFFLFLPRRFWILIFNHLKYFEYHAFEYFESIFYVLWNGEDEELQKRQRKNKLAVENWRNCE